MNIGDPFGKWCHLMCFTDITQDYGGVFGGSGATLVSSGVGTSETIS